MKEKLKQMLKDVDNSYDMALLKIPKAIRQSSWLEFYSKWTRTFTLTQLSSPRLPVHIITKHFYPCHQFALVSPNNAVFGLPSLQSLKNPNLPRWITQRYVSASSKSLFLSRISQHVLSDRERRRLLPWTV